MSDALMLYFEAVYVVTIIHQRHKESEAESLEGAITELSSKIEIAVTEKVPRLDDSTH